MACAVCEKELSGEVEQSEFETNLAQILVSHKTLKSGGGLIVEVPSTEYVFLLRCALKQLCLQKVTGMFVMFNLLLVDSVSGYRYDFRKIKKINDALTVYGRQERRFIGNLPLDPDSGSPVDGGLGKDSPVG
jgi:hypothetical protein